MLTECATTSCSSRAMRRSFFGDSRHRPLLLLARVPVGALLELARA